MATTLRPLYASQTALTVTALATLAADANLLAGWQSAAFDNTTNLYDDAFLTAKIQTGTSPTANATIEIWVAGCLDDVGSVWPDTISGSQGAVTLTSTNTKNSGLWNAGLITIDSTNSRTYPFRPIAIAQAFGGILPPKFSIFITQNSGVALGSTQAVSIIPVQFQGV